MSSALSIYYATVTGNAESLALRAEARALGDGIAVEVRNLADLKPDALPADGLALFIVSTWGDGEPQADASDFWYGLEKAALNLGGLRYAVFGLGDRDYSDYNAFARKLDERLAVLGGQRLQERIEADLQFEDTYVDWESRIFPLLSPNRANMGS